MVMNYEAFDLEVALDAATELKDSLQVLKAAGNRHTEAVGCHHQRSRSLTGQEYRSVLLDARRSVRIAEAALRPRRMSSPMPRSRNPEVTTWHADEE
jgi:hypothetical protein